MGGSIERGKEIGENLESKGWKVKYTIYEGGKNKGKMNWLGENVRDGHGGGWSRKINAWHLYTLMVYL
jgi:hypothetical protein